MSATHLSDLALNRLLAEEASGLEDARAHLAKCEQCRSALEALQSEREAWGARTDKAAFVGAVLAAAESSPQTAEVVRPVFGAWRNRVLAASVGLAAAAVLVVVLRPEATVSVKGAPAVTLLVVDDDSSRPIREDERLRPGDRVGLSVSCPEGCRVYLHDASGAPLASRAFAVPAGGAKVLDFTATLDASHDDEQLAVVACREEVPLDVRKAVIAGHAEDGCIPQRLRIPRAEARPSE